MTLPDSEDTAWERKLWQRITAPPKQRAELVSEQIAELAKTLPVGHRLGSKEELQRRTGVSVGTFNEALRLLQSQGVVSVRRGPGGGIFVAEQSPLDRLRTEVVGNVHHGMSARDIDDIQTALFPLVLERAVKGLAVADGERLLEHVDEATKAGEQRDPELLRSTCVSLYRGLLDVLDPSDVVRSFAQIALELELTTLDDHEPIVPPESEFEAYSAVLDAVAEAIRSGSIEGQRWPDRVRFFVHRPKPA